MRWWLSPINASLRPTSSLPTYTNANSLKISDNQFQRMQNNWCFHDLASSICSVGSGVSSDPAWPVQPLDITGRWRWLCAMSLRCSKPRTSPKEGCCGSRPLHVVLADTDYKDPLLRDFGCKPSTESHCWAHYQLCRPGPERCPLWTHRQRHSGYFASTISKYENCGNGVCSSYLLQNLTWCDSFCCTNVTLCLHFRGAPLESLLLEFTSRILGCHVMFSTSTKSLFWTQWMPSCKTLLCLHNLLKSRGSQCPHGCSSWGPHKTLTAQRIYYRSGTRWPVYKYKGKLGDMILYHAENCCMLTLQLDPTLAISSQWAYSSDLGQTLDSASLVHLHCLPHACSKGAGNIQVSNVSSQNWYRLLHARVVGSTDGWLTREDAASELLSNGFNSGKCIPKDA